MLIINTVLSLRQHIHYLRQKGQCIALVPTMGNLHNGHIKLVNEAKTHADIVVVTIFINPMQFDCVNDLSRYPRTLQEDYKKLSECQVDLVFSPSLHDMYPQGIEKNIYVEAPITPIIFEDINYRRHFRGVLTIVSKLFNLIQPDIACFGEKDYQQLVLIRKLVVDMGYNIKIISIPIIRDENGLAFSSRNNYLTTEQRNIASNINKIINIIAENLISRNFNLRKIITFAEQELSNNGFHTNNIQILDADTLLTLTRASKCAVILIATWLGSTRLIDNKVINFKKTNFNN